MATSLRGASTVVVALALIACRDTVSGPMPDRLAPNAPDLTLTGGAGTEIFPTVAPGETQPRGDARGLNSMGQVTGAEFGLVSSDQDYKPYRWSPGVGAVKLTGCCNTEWGNDINDSGVIVGVTQTSASTGNRGFVASGTSMVVLSLLPGADPEFSSGALALNNSGQVVGMSPVGSSASHAVLWSSSGAIQDLGTLGGTNSIATDINASGQVIGSSQIAGNAATHFFLWSASTGMQDLTTQLGAITSVVEINAAGQIIGNYTTAGGGTHAFLYTPGSGLRDLGTLGGTTSTATGLNNKGDVVGSSTLGDGSTHAFLWTVSDGMEDITALTGVAEVRRLNDNLQTLTGTSVPSTSPNVVGTRPRLVQLQVTQSNSPPTALFTWSCNGLTCRFDGSSSLDDKGVVSYSWDLGKSPDGSATGADVTTTYPHAGQRTITLTVTDAQGQSNSVAKTITLSDQPIAVLTVSCTGLTCTFDSSKSTDDGTIARRFFYFGDGTNAFDVVTATHTYAQPGIYEVALEVWDEAQNKARIATHVTVTGPSAFHPPINQPTEAAHRVTETAATH